VNTSPTFRPLADLQEPEPYREPTLQELMELGKDFGLIRSVERLGDGRLRIQAKEEAFTTNLHEAQLLVRGLLIGYFAYHTRDDLSLANWEN